MTIILLFIGFIIYLIVTNPGFFQKIYLWLIGLAGIISWPFKKLWDWVNPAKELKTIEQDNARLKRELAQIQQDLAMARNKLEEERKLNKVKIEDLEQKIAAEDERTKAIKEELKRLQGQSLEEFKDSLKPEERDKVLKDAWHEVDFGLQ